MSHYLLKTSHDSRDSDEWTIPVDDLTQIPGFPQHGTCACHGIAVPDWAALKAWNKVHRKKEDKPPEPKPERKYPALRKGGYRAFNLALLWNLPMLLPDPMDRLIVIDLMSYGFRAYPTYETIGSHVMLDKSNVRKRIKRMVEAGLIEISERRRHSNRYDLRPLYRKLNALFSDWQQFQSRRSGAYHNT